MVAESLNIVNQFPVDSSSLPRTKTIKMVHTKKESCCSKNSQSQINSVSPLLLQIVFYNISSEYKRIKK